MYRFGNGIEIQASHHQVMRSKQCTPKFFTTPPAHPEQKPDSTKYDANAHKQWLQKANRFARFYLTTFRPEPDLYAINQKNTYSYTWNDLETFVQALHHTRGANNDIAIDRFRLDYMTTMIHALKTSHRNQAILCDYHARDATRW